MISSRNHYTPRLLVDLLRSSEVEVCVCVGEEGDCGLFCTVAAATVASPQQGFPSDLRDRKKRGKYKDKNISYFGVLGGWGWGIYLHVQNI